LHSRRRNGKDTSALKGVQMEDKVQDSIVSKGPESKPNAKRSANVHHPLFPRRFRDQLNCMHANVFVARSILAIPFELPLGPRHALQISANSVLRCPVFNQYPVIQ